MPTTTTISQPQVKHARSRMEEAELQALEEDLQAENGTLSPPPHWLPVVPVHDDHDHSEPVSVLQLYAHYGTPQEWADEILAINGLQVCLAAMVSATFKIFTDHHHACLLCIDIPFPLPPRRRPPSPLPPPPPPPLEQH